MTERLEEPSYGAQGMFESQMGWQGTEKLSTPAQQKMGTCFGSGKQQKDRDGFCLHHSAEDMECLLQPLLLWPQGYKKSLLFLYHRITIKTQPYLSLSLSSCQYFHFYILSHHLLHFKPSSAISSCYMR